MANQAGGDVFNREQAEKLLYPAKGLAVGGQLEVRMEVSPDHPDPDIRGVARELSFSISRAGITNGRRSPRKMKNWRRASNRRAASKPPMSFICARPTFTAGP